METPLYSISPQHAWALQLQPGLLLVNVCVCKCVSADGAGLHIPFASHNKLSFNFTTPQSYMKVCATDF